MSTTTRRPPTKWIPERLARLTVDQYEAMVESGVFTKRDLTLINGLLVTKVTKNRPQRSRRRISATTSIGSFRRAGT